MGRGERNLEKRIKNRAWELETVSTESKLFSVMSHENNVQRALAQSPPDFRSAYEALVDVIGDYRSLGDNDDEKRAREKMKSKDMGIYTNARLAAGDISRNSWGVKSDMDSYRRAVELYESIGCHEEVKGLKSQYGDIERLIREEDRIRKLEW